MADVATQRRYSAVTYRVAEDDPASLEVYAQRLENLSYAESPGFSLETKPGFCALGLDMFVGFAELLLLLLDRQICSCVLVGYGVWTLQNKFFFAPLLDSPLYSIEHSRMPACVRFSILGRATKSRVKRSMRCSVSEIDTEVVRYTGMCYMVLVGLFGPVLFAPWGCGVTTVSPDIRFWLGTTQMEKATGFDPNRPAGDSPVWVADVKPFFQHTCRKLPVLAFMHDNMHYNRTPAGTAWSSTSQYSSVPAYLRVLPGPGGIYIMSQYTQYFQHTCGYCPVQYTQYFQHTCGYCPVQYTQYFQHTCGYCPVQYTQYFQHTCGYCPVQYTQYFQHTCGYCPVQYTQYFQHTCGYCPVQYTQYFQHTCGYCPVQRLGIAAGGSALATCMADVCVCVICARSGCKKPFLGLLVIIAFLGLASGIVLFVSKNEVNDTLDDRLRTSLEMQYGQPGEEGVTAAWDRTQEKLQCCGVGNSTSGYLAWRRSMWYANQTDVSPSAQVPQSCCLVDDVTGQARQCQFDVPNQFLNDKGCQDDVQNVFFDHVKELGIAATAVSLIELMILLVTLSTLRDLQ
ncbi:hypothetical protein Bbelb_363090 [Branchiostoma belcheri]|nr:hypothetical protein Bbelb_363090 [Branchiostoma belcheri]